MHDSAASSKQNTAAPAATAEVTPVEQQPQQEPYLDGLKRLPVQCKLSVGSPDDPLEKEADTMADRVMRMPEHSFIQRKCAACEEEEKLQRKPNPDSLPVQAKPITTTPFMQRKCAECENEEDKEILQRQPLSNSITPFIQSKGNGAASVSDSLSGSIQNSRGRGAPLDGNSQSFMEARFGVDFSSVKIHTDSDSVQMNKELNAQAFTVGNDVYFNEGKYQPDTNNGKRLLAHELTHVLQQGHATQTDNIQRDTPTGGAPDSPSRMEIVQAAENSKAFQINLRNGRTTVSFPVTLNGRFDLQAGSYTLSKDPGIGEPEGTDLSTAAIFFIKEYGEWIYIILSNDDKDKMPHLRTLQANINAGTHCTLQIVPFTKDAQQESKPSDKSGDSTGTKFIEAEPWLEKGLLPAIKVNLSTNTSVYKPDKLIAYISLPIREQEGMDVAMIQIEKNSDKNKLKLHQRVYKSKWQGQKPDSQQQYAIQVSDAILEKIEKASVSAQEAATLRPWMLQLKKQVEDQLAKIRLANPKNTFADIPDRLSVDTVGDTYYFHIHVRKQTDNGQKQLWRSARMTPALDEGDLKSVPELVKTVRMQTALISSWPVKTADTSDKALTNVLMQEILSKIDPLNMGANITSVTQASNSFRMLVQFTDYFGISNTGMPSLDAVSKAYQMFPAGLEYTWKAVYLSAANYSSIIKNPDKKDDAIGKDRVFEDLNSKSLDLEGKSQLAKQFIDYKGLMDGTANPSLGKKDQEISYTFPAGQEGVYLLLSKVTPMPLEEGTTRMIFPPSYAVLPIRVVELEKYAHESVDNTLNEIEQKKLALTNPKLKDEDKKSLQDAIDRMGKEESMSQVDLSKSTLAQLDEKKALLLEFKKWRIDDAKNNKTINGNNQENLFITRLLLHGQVIQKNLYSIWTELFSIYHYEAFSTTGLDSDYHDKQAQSNPINAYLSVLDGQSEALRSLIGKMTAEENGFLAGSSLRPVATLVLKESGLAIPLLLILGQIKDSSAGTFQYRIIDLTFSSTPLFKRNDNTYTGDPDQDRNTAINNAFITYGKDNKLEQGSIVYRIAGHEISGSVPNVKTVTEHAEEIAMYLALLGAVASVALSGGASTPAVAAILAVIAIANAAFAGFLAYQHISKRHEDGTMELDADMALEIINVLASAVGIGVMAKTAKLAKLAKAADLAGDVGKGMQTVAQIQRIGKAMLVFDAVTLGGTATLVSVKVSDDLKKIDSLKIPQQQKDLLYKQVAFDAVIQGAMLAFQTAVMARMHLDAYRQKIESSRYQTMEERGWIDAQGKFTDEAPPELRKFNTGEKEPVSIPKDVPDGRQALSGVKADQRIIIDGAPHQISVGYENGKFYIKICSDCQNLINKIDSLLPLIKSDPSKKDLVSRLTKLRGQLEALNTDINAGRLDGKSKGVQKTVDDLAFQLIAVANENPTYAPHLVGTIMDSSNPAFHLPPAVGESITYRDDGGVIGKVTNLGNDTLQIETTLGQSTIRADYNNQLPTPSKVGLPSGRNGFERLHAIGPDVGHESPHGIFYGPWRINQLIQRLGIESFLHNVGANVRPGERLKLRVTVERVSANYRDPVSKKLSPYKLDFLKTITYQVFAEPSATTSKPVKLFEMTIGVKEPTNPVSEANFNPSQNFISSDFDKFVVGANVANDLMPQFHATDPIHD